MKKWSFILTVCLVVCCFSVYLYAATANIVGIDDGKRLGEVGLLVNGKEISPDELHKMTIYGKDEILVSLPVELFTWSNSVPASSLSVSTEMLESSGIGVRVEGDTGSLKIPNLTEKKGVLYIQLKFGEPATNGTYAATVFLTVNGARHNASALQLKWKESAVVPQPDQSGERIYHLDDDFLSVDSTGSSKVWLNGNTLVYTNLSQDRLYSGGAGNWERSRYKTLANQVPDIAFVVSAQLGYNTTMEYKPANGHISFDYHGDLYFVYNLAGEYLGRPFEKLPFLCNNTYADSMYIFATEPLYIKGGIERLPNYTLKYYEN